MKKAYLKALGPETRAHVAYIRARNRLAKVRNRIAPVRSELHDAPPHPQEESFKGYSVAFQNGVARRVASASAKGKPSRRLHPVSRRV